MIHGAIGGLKSVFVGYFGLMKVLEVVVLSLEVVTSFLGCICTCIWPCISVRFIDIPWGMAYLNLGFWPSLAVVAVLAVIAFVAYLSLRGSKPKERADILRALADFTAALSLRSPRPSSPPQAQDDSIEPEPDSDEKTAA